MLIGIISDTHDNVEALQKAIAKFNKQKVGTVFHCGDWSSFYMPTLCDNLDCEMFSVLGNNDIELACYSGKSVGKVSFSSDNFFEKEIGGRKIAMCHGNSAFLLNSLLGSGNYDLVLSGHTHIASIEKVAKTLHINPGSPFQTRNNIPGVAIYDTKNGRSKLIHL
jgi:uncharacterized protein